MTIIQILLILFALFAWSRALLRARSKTISMGEFFFWSLIWIAIIVVGLFPNVIRPISDIVGIESGINLAVYVGIILSLYLIFRIYVKMDTQNQEITKLVREIAIKDAKSKDAKNRNEHKKK